MCLIFIAYRHDARYPLVVAANRDEFYARPTSAADYWTDCPGVLAGRDREAGGTWLGMNQRGAFCALTNFRNPALGVSKPPSRGALVADFLTTELDAASYAQTLMGRAKEYNGFGLLLLGGDGLVYCSNGGQTINRRLDPGLYGLSNHLLDTPWPKVTQGKKAVRSCLRGELSIERLFDVMMNRELAEDSELPDTGVGVEMESGYSPAFVDMEFYGTRSTTVIVVDHAGKVQFHERTHARPGTPASERVFRFEIALASSTSVRL